MDAKLIEMVKEFVKEFRAEMKSNKDFDFFGIAIVGEGGRAGSISTAMYREVKAGSIARERYPISYEVADKVFAYATSKFEGIAGVQIMLTKGGENRIVRDKKVLRVFYLEA